MCNYFLLQTPTPSDNGHHDNRDLQLQDSPTQHMDMQGTSTPRLNRLASLRLHQQLIQSHDKPWTNHNDVSSHCRIKLF